MITFSGASCIALLVAPSECMAVQRWAGLKGLRIDVRSTKNNLDMDSCKYVFQNTKRSTMKMEPEGGNFGFQSKSRQ